MRGNWCPKHGGYAWWLTRCPECVKERKPTKKYAPYERGSVYTHKAEPDDPTPMFEQVVK